MKKILLLILVSLSLLSNSYAEKSKQTDQSIDRIVAIVNDDVVTRTELKHNLSLIKMQMTQAHASLPSQDVLRQQVLNQIIDKKIQLQIASQIGIKVTENDLDSLIQRIADQNQVSVEGLYTQLLREGMSIEDYRHEMHDQITLQKLQQQEVINHISVTPEEITAFMHSDMWKGTNGSDEAANRKQAENALLQRKFGDAIKNWVSKLRAQAFVKISSAATQA